MSSVWTAGFEPGDFSECGGSSAGSPTVQGTIVNSGSKAAKFPSGAAAYKESTTGLNLPTAYFRLYVYLAASPTERDFAGFASNLDLSIASFLVTNSGNIKTFNSVTSTTLGTGSAVIPVTTWTLVEFKLVISATVGVVEVKVGGAVDQTYTGLNTGVLNTDRIFFGPDNGNLSTDIYYDDLAVDDAGYPGAVPSSSVSVSPSRQTIQQYYEPEPIVYVF